MKQIKFKFDTLNGPSEVVYYEPTNDAKGVKNALKKFIADFGHNLNPKNQ